MTPVPAHDETPYVLLAREIGPFLEGLRALRYAHETLQRKLAIAKEFTKWAEEKAITVESLNSGTVAAFVARLPQPAKSRMVMERAAVRMFLKHLQRRGDLQCHTRQESDSGPSSYLRRYEDYLRSDRGLAENSVHVYVPFIRDFLSGQSFQDGCLSREALETLNIRSFLLSRTKDRSDEHTRLLTIALRSFFRFLFFAGEIPRDLSSSVPMVRQY